MRRSRRYRWLTMSIVMIVYSVFHSSVGAPSEPETGLTIDEPILKSNEAVTPVEETKKESTKEDTKIETNEGSKSKAKEGTKDDTERRKEGNEEVAKDEKEDKTDDKKVVSNEKDGEEDENMVTKPVTVGPKEKEKIQGSRLGNANATTKPLRDCVPAIEQFPRPLMGQNVRKHGGLIIHFLVAIFTFVGLAIVCDEYFVNSLDRICEELKLAPDVAGATFMAAGSSAPELATVVIGVFVARDDIGLSGVIGSAVFNIMFVISVCALCAGTVSHLNWWPLCRDCFFYALSILVLVLTICDRYVSWYEALFMLLMYVVYCVALRFNTQLERLALRYPLPIKLPTREEQAALVTFKAAPKTAGNAPGEGKYAEMEGSTKETPMPDTHGAYENAAYNAEPQQTWDPLANAAWGDDSTAQAPVWDPNSTWNTNDPYAQPQQPQPQPQTQAASQGTPEEKQVTVQPVAPNNLTYYKSKEYNPDMAVNPLLKPQNAKLWQMIWWYVAYPVHWTCLHTMPDVHGRWYPVTFLMSMLWISFYSYFMVWMITIIGFTLGIPDTVMGLTFVAAGVSVPDAISSLAVIKEGYGDMAVSNAVGSNVFDILVCLGLPWFIQTAIVNPGSKVNVISKGLTYSTLSLFSTVIFLVVATHANGWKLDRKYGIILMVWYILFVTFASLYELNVFGNVHPTNCFSDY